jgi:hypothetical protein
VRAAHPPVLECEVGWLSATRWEMAANHEMAGANPSGGAFPKAVLLARKRKGAPTSDWKSPGAPEIHRLGCGCEPVRRYNDRRANLFPAMVHFQTPKKKKAPAPPGAPPQQGDAPIA